MSCTRLLTVTDYFEKPTTQMQTPMSCNRLGVRYITQEYPPSN